jgi:uncharacterized membrane protein
MFLGFSLFVIIFIVLLLIFSKSARKEIEWYILLFGYVLFYLMLLYD